MATTTNFGWTTPDDTDLVKDGAAAIRTALGGVDTSFVDLKGGTTGQVLAKNSNTDLDFTWSADAGIPASILDAKGDLIAATAADTASRLAVGTNGQVLTADSTESTGLKWAAASGGDLIRIVTTTFTAQAGVVFANCFTSTYDNYFLVANVECSTGTPAVTLRLRSGVTDYSTGDQYYGYIYSVWNNSVTGAGSTTDTVFASYNTNTTGLNFEHIIYNPFASKVTQGQGSWVDSTDNGSTWSRAGNTNSYDSLNLTVSTGTISGEVSIYGYKRA